MDDPPSDGNDRVADIVMVSTDETATILFKESLEKNGYRVVVFADGAPVKEALDGGKPKLLIYDSKTGEQEGYEVIRQIKADSNLRVNPTLILTTASSMENLLAILESNTDNFIAPPYNLPDHFSLIDGMLATPVERQTGEEITKQFKVRHDDHTYIVAATSRKLLEYLLTSFEILAGKSSELSSVVSQLREVSDNAKDLDRTLTALTRDIEMLNASIRQKEQTIIALTKDLEKLKETLSQKTDEIQILKQESEKNKTHLDSVGNELNKEKIRTTSLEKALQDRMAELEQQKSALVAEKERSESEEQEINTVRQAKTQSERELTQIITGLDETAKHRIEELTRLKSEMDAEINRRVLAEAQAGSLQQEYEQSRNSLRSETEALNRQLGELQERLTASDAALETERELRRISEEKTHAAIRQQEDLENRNRIANEDREQAKADQAPIIVQKKEETTTSGLRIQSPGADTGNLAREKSHAEQDVRMLTAELERPGTFPASECRNHPGADEGHSEAVKERHQVQQPLFLSDVGNTTKKNLDLVISDEPHLPMIVNQESSPEESPAADNQIERPAFFTGAKEESGTAEKSDRPENELRSARTPDEAPGETKGTTPTGDISFNSNQWLDLLKWAHHSEALSEDQRVRIVRMGRLIQKDRKLTKHQQEQVREILSLVRALGYQHQVR